MARLPEEFLQRLRDANDIVDMFRSYAEVKKRGRTYVCCCPFHSEKTPSCTIYPENQSFFCFGCGVGGDSVTFVRKMENVGYMDAVQILAQRAGMQLPARSPDEERTANLRRRCLEINRETANFYYMQLVKGEDKRGLQYFLQRQLRPETIKKYGLGFAPDAWNLLRDHLRSKGYHENEMVAAGVCRQSEKGNVYDYFRNRVMFPIVDTKGSVIAFGGRVLDDSKPKYLNTNDTPVFNKGKNLFSLNFAKNASSTTFLLAEGYMDVIAVNQAGFDNVVATLGTAITPDQARLIAQYAKEVVISYDSDGAGQAATQRAMNHFADVGLPCRILKMEGAKDPDEFIKKFGRDRFRMLIDQAGDVNLFQLERCKQGLDTDTEIGKTEYLRRVVQVLSEIENDLQREVYISRISHESGIRKEVLLAQVTEAIKKHRYGEKRRTFRAIESQSLQRDELNPDAKLFPRESKAEERILAYLMQYPEDCEMLWQRIPPELFRTEFHRKLYVRICTFCKETGSFDASAVQEELTVEEFSRLIGISARYRDTRVTRNVVEECADVLHQAQQRITPGEDMSDDDLLQLVASRKQKK
ncbi:MAG: DNA primase [Oscillospiraceae bacterium]|nr:DNA primase [Oscillospiraceae bacterium]